MAVKIITDSLSDITSDLAQELGVTVVPVYVRFGEEVYRDRIEMTTEEFYRRLVHGAIFPTTTQPSPGDFINVYEKLAKETDEILVVTLSNKLSGTYQSALQAKNLMEGKCRIEVIDSETVVMGLGLIVISVAKAAKSGASLDELLDLVRKAMPRAHPIMSFDTLKYLAKGGRIGKAQSFLGSMLAVKPILTIRDGEVHPVTRVRSRAAGKDYLYNFVAGFSKIEELAVEHATTPDEAEELIERLGSVYPKERIYRSTVSPVIGTYVGPHVLSVSVLEAEKA
ncbi:MAG TPA: DegV family protein [Dehalococcoidales bacterium]|nr:DegV family protein [Dehalococcoidales bacterium]